MDTPNHTPYRKCSTCGIEFPATREYFHKNGDELCRYCVSCACARARRWRENNLEKDRAHSRAYRAQHVEEARERSLNYNKAHRADKREYDRIYRESHNEQRKANHHTRRARKKGNGGTLTAADITMQIRSQTDKKGQLHCWWCGEKLNKWHVDHVIPLARGGSNAPENIVISCPTCNMTRKDKLPHEWNGRLF